MIKIIFEVIKVDEENRIDDKMTSIIVRVYITKELTDRKIA